ncbi:unnamed protein product [Merluccius merluccius]
MYRQNGRGGPTGCQALRTSPISPTTTSPTSTSTTSPTSPTTTTTPSRALEAPLDPAATAQARRGLGLTSQDARGSEVALREWDGRGQLGDDASRPTQGLSMQVCWPLTRGKDVQRAGRRRGERVAAVVGHRLVYDAWRVSCIIGGRDQS